MGVVSATDAERTPEDRRVEWTRGYHNRQYDYLMGESGRLQRDPEERTGRDRVKLGRLGSILLATESDWQRKAANAAYSPFTRSKRPC
jgi:hypothetical protein